MREPNKLHYVTRPGTTEAYCGREIVKALGTPDQRFVECKDCRKALATATEV